MRVFKRTWKARTGARGEAWALAFHDPATGRTVRRTLPGVTTKRDAEAAGALVVADAERRALAVRLGLDCGPDLAQRALTLADLFDRDVRRSGIADATRRLEREAAHRPLVAFFGDAKPVAALSHADLERFVKDRLAAGLKPRSVNLPLQVLRAAIRRAVAAGLLHREPVKIKLLPDRPAERRPLNRDEARRLIDAAGPLGIADEVTVLLALGLRRGELFSLRWRDVDRARGLLRITTEKRGASSSYASDSVPLNAAAREVFARRADAFPHGKPSAERLVFGVAPEDRRPSTRRKPGRPPGSEGGAVHTRAYRFASKLKRAAKLAGIDAPERVTPHLLRHTAATLLVESGADIKTVQRVLRHRSAETTLRVYAHARLDTIREAVAALDFSGAKVVPVVVVEEARDAIG